MRQQRNQFEGEAFIAGKHSVQDDKDMVALQNENFQADRPLNESVTAWVFKKVALTY